ncbi:MAG: glycoside hydrolase family 68 protein [Sphingomonadales bacterium]|nr:glycoside hydrolase family 68 protein [Sphingomonadales bacterium]
MSNPDVKTTTHSPVSCTPWRPDADIDGAEIPLIGGRDAIPILSGTDLWDCWPLAREDGSTAVVDGRQYWFFLSAPCFPDPVQRHHAAKIRLVSLGPDGWRDHGDCLPDALSPGSREWAGSAVLHDDGVNVTLFFTAAGRRGEGHSFEQRLFAVRGRLGQDGPGEWSDSSEVVRPDGDRYFVAAEGEGTPGLIKGFRDPAWFRDPATGQSHLLFTGSAGWDDDAFNGVIGLISCGTDGAWHLADPLIDSIGVNNELERPHMLVRDGLYYLFWSTQRRTFAPGVPSGPNGLYAMVADQLTGPYRPVNGNGLVAANPAAEPTQTYSWWVTGEGEVWSFIDHWGLKGRALAEHPELLRQQFGGTPAPRFRLVFHGDSVNIT